ncbi:MAG: 50S ribosomal protein L17 [Gemmatales bacterium]|nr:50S ribosomal protein L17 [Gemmatales bacterium]MDW8221519.1 50S ribosomal protein L17 [Gemmatales bacterium]
MRHLKAGRKLGRNAAHRRALMRNLAWALFEHERITTTVAKAKELRRFVEPIITLARKGTLHARRLVLARMGGKKRIWMADKDGNEIEVDLFKKLFQEIAPRYRDRPGGYTRIIKLATRRLGDAAPTAIIELVKEPLRLKERRQATAQEPVRPQITP